MKFPAEDNMPNLTSTTDFLLLEFSEAQDLAVVGNLLIIALVILDHHFFLMKLALLDFGLISVIVPKSMANALMKSRLISYSGGVAQVFFFVFFRGSNIFLLTIMAHDCYVAIFNPTAVRNCNEQRRLHSDGNQCMDERCSLWHYPCKWHFCNHLLLPCCTPVLL